MENEEIKKIIEEIEELIFEILNFTDIQNAQLDFINDNAYKIKELIKKIKEDYVGQCNRN